VLGALALAALLGGCATAYVRGDTALRERRYAEAARAFEEALGRDPDRLDALHGLGVTRFRTDRLDDAATLLARVVERAPESAEARLYLGLVHLLCRRDAEAREQLVAVKGLGPHRRVGALIDGALALIEPGLADPVRAFIAHSLDDAAEWARDVAEARSVPRAPLEPRWLLYWDGHPPYPPRRRP
jgi:tetratricopeptide (TPR) repeat protein